MKKDVPNRFKDWFDGLTSKYIKLQLDWKI